MSMEPFTKTYYRTPLGTTFEVIQHGISNFTIKLPQIFPTRRGIISLLHIMGRGWGQQRVDSVQGEKGTVICFVVVDHNQWPIRQSVAWLLWMIAGIFLAAQRMQRLHSHNVRAKAWLSQARGNCLQELFLRAQRKQQHSKASVQLCYRTWKEKQKSTKPTVSYYK